ncbi:hypothetical protein HOF92_08635 [bacterium]|jgi:esterase/lipase/1-acyl-sn-glycerol-3-phosphate acyltransferase|nr:hypothetical protein [bacterium]
MKKYFENFVFLASKQFFLFFLKYLIRTRVRYAGEENITDHPTLFVASHFTRFETAIIPYVYYLIRGKRITTLADSGLFFGWFGVWLKMCGAYPLQDPNRDSHIIGDLMTGRSCWVIFPEGNMVKNKVLYDRGKFVLDCPDKQGPPHTGAAVLALKAEIFKRSYLRAVEENDRVAMQYYESTYGFSGPSEICHKSTVITPLCITYYPLRTDWELPVKILRKLLKKVPSRLEEEAVIEATFLWKDTDMDHFFGKAIHLDEWVNYLMPIKRGLQRFFRSDDIDNLILEWQRSRLIQRCMQDIYTHTHVNMDMVFSYTIRCLEDQEIPLERLRQILFLSCRMILSDHSIRTHSSIRENLIRLLVDRPYPAFEEILQVGVSEGLLNIDNETVKVIPETYHKNYHFHRVRLKHKLRVCANELEPLDRATSILRKVCGYKVDELKAQIHLRLIEEETAEYRVDRIKSAFQDLEEGDDEHALIFLEGPKGGPGVVLCHDLLHSPQQMESLAEILHSKGYSVICPRLKGHGTGPKDLAAVTFEEWHYSFERAYALLKLRCPEVTFCGMGAGALLAIISAAQKTASIPIFAIQPAFRLRNPDLMLIEPLTRLGKVLSKLGFPRERLEFSQVPQELDTTGYHKIYYSTLKEWKKLRDHSRKELGKLRAPLQLVQLEKDPFLDRPDADWILSKSGSELKKLDSLPLEPEELSTGEGLQSLSKLLLPFLGEVLPATP